jgi:hypothetical protein
MSRSRKRTPICAINGASSEKQDKRLYNRRYRRVCKQHLRVNPECEPAPHLREYSNPWAMAKDGKVWVDQAQHPERMRK